MLPPAIKSVIKQNWIDVHAAVLLSLRICSKEDIGCSTS